MKKLVSKLLLVLSASGIPLADAAAQERGPESNNVSVRERPKPGYDAVGIRAGGFMLYPTLDVGVEQNDNIFSDDRRQESASVVTVKPRIAVQSNWSNHELAFSAESDNRIISDFDNLDTSNTVLNGRARLDVQRGSYIAATALYVDGQEPLNQSPTTGFREPVDYTQQGGSLTGVIGLARTQFTGSVSVNTFDYSDATLFNGSRFDQDDRDRTVTEAMARADLSVSPDTALFLSVTANQRDYDLTPPRVALNRDSDGYEVLLGVNMDITRLIRGEFGVGYFSQNFDDASKASLEELAVRGRLEWFPTELITVGFDAQRGVGDSGFGGATSTIQSRFGMVADYEFARNIIVSGGVDYLRDEFQGFNREDERRGVYLGADYLLNRSAALTGRLSSISQTSDGVSPGPEYDQVVFSIGLRLQR